MHLDVRIPMGLLFTILGSLLVGNYWWGQPTSVQVGSFPLWWGLLMTLFGVINLSLAALAAHQR